METGKLASRIYGLCTGVTGGNPDLSVILTDRVLKKMPPLSADISNHGLLCEAGKHLTMEILKLPPQPAEENSKNDYAGWSFPGRLLMVLQALQGLTKEQRLLFLLRNQWGLGVEDLALCWNVPAEEMFARVKETHRLWRHRLERVLNRKREIL